ncbi:helix-turn-helix domain-containing protein [Neptunitalea lumnitzerae]|uniref:AraC family transcriptional regulator n=1 Tax=Neptunitalea lumnitzerae TaxID=2965509 RepID=A0ABQ5MJ52_9FLAO|nr:helix-turn-helix domain-containing protein [Neptunitalea sp. Y10]GLB49442.1 AraC family transcriptional regulator [Neptunitalea sp. Y10]
MASNHSQIIQYHLHEENLTELQFEIHSLEDYICEHQTKMTKPHSHTYYQILWFEKGAGKHYVDFKEYEVVENTLFFITKNQIHYFDKNPLYNGVVMVFNDVFLADSENYMESFLRDTIFNNFESDPRFQISKREVDTFHRITELMRMEFQEKDDFTRKEYLRHLLNLVLITLQRIGKRNHDVSLPMQHQSHMVLVKFKQLLEKHYKEKHLVQQYAVMLDISVKTLSNVTKVLTQRSPLALINERIVLEAKRLLSYSGMSISEIAFDVGFEDPSYFAKFFKRQSGILPNEFRRLHS